MHRPSPASAGYAVRTDGELILRVLGDPSLDRIAADGTRLRVLGLGKPLALITYLAVAPQHEASREFLADLLWGDNSVSDPLHSLRNALLLISKQADSALIESTPTRCRLARALPSDFTRLSQALGERDLERAMATYTGDFLPEFAAPGCRRFEHWSESVRLRVRTDVANAADVLVRQLLDAGRPRDAERYARRMIEIDPLNERGRRVLLEALIAAGDPMAALTEAVLTEQWLEAEEIDAEPATTALLQQARRARAAPRNSLAAGATGQSGMLEASADLVGRAAEFAAIITAWEGARAGTTTLVSIVAGAGIGKTRLLTDVENRLRAQRAQVVSVRVLADERDVPFALVAAIAGELARLPGAAGVSASTGGVLVGLDSSLSATFRAAADFATSDQVLRRTRALQELLACVSEERSTVLLLDDLHWADDSSLAVLPAIFARLASHRLLVVTTSRPGRGAVLAGDRTRHLPLAALSAEEVGQLIASIRPLPQAPWSEILTHGVYTASRGVPVFALLALRDATTRGLVRLGETTWECDDPAALDAGLREGAPLSTALRDLPPLARRALLKLAVAGRAVPSATLASALDAEPSRALAGALDALERGALISQVGDLVSPAHDVVVESALNGASDDERRTATREMALAMLGTNDRRWKERGVRLFSTVATAGELAPRLAPLIRNASLPRGVGIARTLGAWLGGAPEQHLLARQVARQLPLSLRLRPFRRHLATAGLTASLFSVIPLWNVSHPAARVDATLVGLAVTSDSAIQGFSTPLTPTGWDESSPLDARLAGTGAAEVANLGDFTRPSLLAQRSGERLSSNVYADSGGSDLNVTDAKGTLTRLTRSPGDDVPSSWSPDGRFIVFESSRWSVLRHHKLGILDRITGATRRLTHSDGSEGSGSWSPDGSRIAFSRNYLDGRPGEFCVVDVDGGGDRCTTAAGDLLGWRSPVEILVSPGSSVLAVHPDSSWRRDTVATEAFGATLSPNGRWLAWLGSGTAPGAAFVSRSSEPEHSRRVQMTANGRPPQRLGWGGRGESARYVERLTIQSPTDTIVVGVPHRFTVIATWSDSSTSAPPHVRWRVGPANDGRIDSLGTLIAVRPGTVVVVATAGGWRMTSRRVVAVAAPPRTIAIEEWTNGLGAWRLFGDPFPIVTPDARLGTALLNNGDGSYFSGAYYRRTLGWERGLVVDAVVRTPVNQLQWQTLDIDLRAAKNEQVLAAWDHRTGYMPAASGDIPCTFFYPGTEGASGLAMISPLGPLSTGVRQTRLSIGDGRPYRVRLQVFPDGRCGMAVNGAALFVSNEHFEAGVPLRLTSYGNSWTTRMLLGPLTLMEGVPGDIDWTRLVREIPPAMPPFPPRSTTPRSLK